MNQNEQIVFDFYTAFQHLDANKMISHYSDNIQFEDPAFGTLKGIDAKNMWRMLCENASDFSIQFQINSSTNNKVYAYWEAQYTFSKTGRQVLNKIHAEFTLSNGAITHHTDSFNLWVWSRQAMGLTGWFLGWSSLFKNKLHQTTRKALQKYTLKQSNAE